MQPLVDVAGRHPAHPDLHADLQAYILGVYRTAAEALGGYGRYKATNGLVDFIDQEREALRLLDRPEVGERLRETLSRVFVDEFQDTSPVQLALFLKVSQIAERSFWVGDPKQAIYGFRGTDPALIERAARGGCSEVWGPANCAGHLLSGAAGTRPFHERSLRTGLRGAGVRAGVGAHRAMPSPGCRRPRGAD